MSKNFRRIRTGIDSQISFDGMDQLRNSIINIILTLQSEIISCFTNSKNEIKLLHLGESRFTGNFFIDVGDKEVNNYKIDTCWLDYVLHRNSQFKLKINNHITKMLGDSVKLTWKSDGCGALVLLASRTDEPVSFISNGQICFKFCQNCAGPNHCDWDTKTWIFRIDICQKCAYLTMCENCGNDITFVAGYTGDHFLSHQNGCQVVKDDSPKNLRKFLKQTNSMIQSTGELGLYLDLSTFRGPIEFPSDRQIDIDDEPLVIFLKAHPRIVSVNISNHPEINNLIFSRFRKCLPNLDEFVINDTKLNNISGKQWLKYYANNIWLNMSGVTIESFRENVFAELDQFNLAHTAEEKEKLKLYKTQLFSSEITAEGLFKATREILSINDNAHLKYISNTSMKDIMNNYNQSIKESLIKSWESGKFSHTQAYQNGPKTFADWPKNRIMGKEFYVLYLVVTELELWDKMKLEPGDGGYMWSKLDYVSKIEQHPAVIACGHSGASLACSMRVIQSIAMYGWAKYCESK